jgi:hypothetical protein
MRRQHGLEVAADNTEAIARGARQLKTWLDTRITVRQYQAALHSVLASHPELSACAVHCVHCGIRFLTHPRNARRVDLRCPFGCQGHHRRQCSSQRSTAYYQTACGKAKKKRLNARR